MQIFANGKQHFYFFMEFYVIHLKNQGVKIWSQYHFKSINNITKNWTFLKKNTYREILAFFYVVAWKSFEYN